jgi:uncharacterized protein (DUF4415 family)
VPEFEASMTREQQMHKARADARTSASRTSRDRTALGRPSPTTPSTRQRSARRSATSSPSPTSKPGRLDIRASADDRKRSSLAIANPEFYRPLKKPITLRLDADVLAWFKKDGRRYQTRINQALRQAMEREMKKLGSMSRVARV